MKYVACLCGCPGGGKSTFARRLHAEMVGRHAGVLSPVIVSFDEVAADYFGLLTFKEIRAKALDIVADLIRSSDDMHNVIIIDDTMHYHSMRREVYTLVRDLQGMLRMVWLICDVDTAVERDKIRESSLGEKTVRKVFSIFEAPRQENIWERDPITADMTSTASTAACIDQICADACRIIAIDKVEAKEVKQDIRSGSLVDTHQADIMLRKCVTIAIKRIRDPLSGIIKSKTKDAIFIINKAKAEALFAVRSECSLAATNFSLLPVVSSAFCSALSHGFKSLNIFGDEYITDGIKSTASVDYFVELLFSELLSDESKSLFTT